MSKTIGSLLRLKRLEKNYTLEMTAKQVGVSINYISKLEKGESIPSDEVMVKLAIALDLDEDELFNAYGRIPLSTRETLENHPAISKLISEINNNASLNDERKEKFLKTAIKWYKKIAEEDDD